MFSNDELRGFIRGEILGDVFPYHTNDHQEVEKHLERLFYRIKRIHGVECEADFDHYGSGYASFVEFFLPQKNRYKGTVDKQRDTRKRNERHYCKYLSSCSSRNYGGRYAEPARSS